jgi:hypothetical protein
MLKKQSRASAILVLIASLCLCITSASKSSAQDASGTPPPPQVIATSTPDAANEDDMAVRSEQRSMSAGASSYHHSVMGGGMPMNHASGGSAGIQQTVFGFVDNGSHRETLGYGRYSYVVFLHRDRRAVALLSDILSSTAQEGTIATSPAQLNLLEIPVRTRFWGSPVGVAVRNGVADTASATEILSQYYDEGAAQDIMHRACQDPSVSAKICKGRLSQGPFLVTLPHAMSDDTLLNPPYLVVDLGGVSPIGFDYFVERFKEEADSDSLSDRSRIDNFKNRILALVLDASDWLPGTVSTKDIAAEAGAE